MTDTHLETRPDLLPTGDLSDLNRHVDAIETSTETTDAPTLDLGGDLSSQVGTKATCKQCGAEFTRRAGSGGKAQVFCSTECRKASHKPAQPKPTMSAADAAAFGNRIEKALAAARPEPDFDWDGDDKESVAVSSQHGIAVYWNKAGHVVIRQESWDDDDHFIWCRPDNLPALIRALQTEYDAWKEGRE